MSRARSANVTERDKRNEALKNRKGEKMNDFYMLVPSRLPSNSRMKTLLQISLCVGQYLTLWLFVGLTV